MFESLLRYLREAGWPYNAIEGHTAVRLIYGGDNGKWPCVARVREDSGQFLFYSIVPDDTPEDRLDAVQEFVTRANYGMVTGNFELDLDDGEVRFKTSIGNLDALEEEQIRHIISVNVWMMDKYLPGIRAVFQGISAREALVKVEG